MNNRTANNEIKGKITMRQLRCRAAARGLLTVRELATHVGCSRPSIYFAIERPSRFPIVYGKLLEIMQ